MSRGDGAMPVIGLFVHDQHQLPKGFDFASVERVGRPAFEEVLKLAKDGAVLAELDEVEVTLVSDEVIADVHVEFMGIAGATDVITFDHGEILISTETAAVQGAENGNSIECETALYLVHGLLHLAGYGDKTEEEFTEMARVQELILGLLWGGGRNP